MKNTSTLFRPFLFLALLFLSNAINAQTLTQTIRGQVVDTDTKGPLPGATLVVLGTDPVIATTTDMDGYYELLNIPVGKVDIQIRFLGYEEKIIPGVTVLSGKETQVSVVLQESIEKLDMVEVTPDARDKDDLTEMSIISTTSFTMAEAQRAPGSFNDPSRMASTFAGVSTDPSGNNDIIVRGNSPKGVQWRLDGIEIPNPNHFSDEGTTGGAINVINSDMLANSSFYTGAFAPEFGNAFSGIMDLELRTGNKAKREYSLTAGVLGLEATAEGPFVKGKKASYLVNYRYSTLALLDKIKLVDYGGVPDYQDGLFKIHLPTKRAGVFSVFGVGGFSSIQEEYVDSTGFVNERFLFRSYMGIVGLKHSIPLSSKTYIKTDFSAAINGNLNDGEETIGDTKEFYTYYNDRMQRLTNAFNTSIGHKFNARHLLKVGVGVRVFSFDYETTYPDENETTPILRLNEKGNATLLNAYASYKFRITQDLTLVSGVHFQHFLLNEATTVEPRASMKWNFSDRQSVFGGIGMHSRIEPLTTYFSIVTDEFGNTSQPNKNLGFSKSVHYVLGYENRITPHLTFKAEVYYQQLYNLPVDADITSGEAALNSYGYFNDIDWINKGKGRNYGLELTLERYFHNQYYFTFTTSLYQAKYTALDGVERNTRFNGNFALNAIGGKEFNVGKDDKHRTIGVTARFTWAGGQRYTPVLLAQSMAEDETVLDGARKYSERTLGFYKLNLAFYYTRQLKRVSHSVKLDVENATNNQAKLAEFYDSATQELVYNTQMEILPVIRYTLNF